MTIEPKGRRGHFDLCIWNPKTVGKRLFRSKGSEDFESEQETLIAIEFDLVEHNDSIDDAVDHFVWDLMKLGVSKGRRNEVRYGYILTFVRDYIHAPKFLARIKARFGSEPNVRATYVEHSGNISRVEKF